MRTKQTGLSSAIFRKVYFLVSRYIFPDKKSVENKSV